MIRPTHAAIAADSPLTTEAGARIARQGGNAVDIAAGAALAATVSEVLMCSLGGSAFVMVHLPGQSAELIDGADVLPHVAGAAPSESAAWRTAHLAYGDGIDVKVGHATVAVPGMLAAIDEAWRRHGTLSWAEICAPALELARSTIPASPTLAQWLTISGTPIFSHQEACRRSFFNSNSKVLAAGEHFQIAHLDQTWECLAREGARVFYEGDLAAAFAKEMEQQGGFVTREDLAAYRAEMRKPLTLSSRGFELALNPPPAIGGTALGFLIRLLDMGWRDESSGGERALLHALAQARLLTFREERVREWPVDDSVAQGLLEDGCVRDHLSALHSPSTTHVSVVTEDGAMVAVTMSMGYGSGVIIPATGIACNNSLGEPELNPHGYHAGTPGRRLISNMAPTVGWHRDGRCLALGSPGASRITTSIAQTWVRHVFEGMTMEEAVTAPRLHVEPIAGSPARQCRAQCEPGIDASLLQDRFLVRPFERPDMYFGAVKLAGLDERGRLHGVADERRHGAVEFV